MAKIIGNTTATPNPQSDWNQTDKTKADYIKNKPTILTEEDVVELIISSNMDSGRIPVVYTLPTNANDGDICIYSPANVPTVDDSGKLIYVDWDVFNQTFVREDYTQFIITFYDANEAVVGSIYATSWDNGDGGYDTTFEYTKGNEQWNVSFLGGVFDAEGSSYTNGDSVTYLAKAPEGFILPYFSSYTADNYDISGNVFYAPIKLMIYRGGWYEYTFDSFVDVGIYHGYTLPKTAKEGDLCLYAPQNTITLADSEKRIYFDWNEFSKPVEDGNTTNISCLLASEYDGINDQTNCQITITREPISCWVAIEDATGNSIHVVFDNGVMSGATWGDTELNSVEELPTYYQLPYFDEIYDWYTEGDTYLFHSEYELMKYQGGEWMAAVEADVSDKQIADAVRDYIRENPIEVPGVPTKTSQLENDSGFITVDDIPEGSGSVDLTDYYTKQEIDNKGFITADELPEGTCVIDSTLSIKGAAADAKATGNRLTDIEYQTVTTELAYEHKELPTGEKTVTVSGDGTFGNNAYIVCDEDIIPRKTYNRNFPYNGITISRDDKTYHIEGVATADGSVVFVEEKNTTVFEINKNIAGKTFKMLTFINQYTDGNMTFVVQFLDSDKKVVQVLKSNGSLSNYISSYLGSTTGYREVNFSIPENVEIKYVQAYITFKANYTYNHDFQIYFAEAENIQTVTLDNPTSTITNEDATSVFSAPYQSTTETKTPITDYIRYMMANAKGDMATYLTPEAFGAIGDGYEDDTEAVKACIAKAAETKQTVIMAKSYYITSPIDIAYDNMQIIINSIVYNGTESAMKIHSSRNTIKIQSVNSSSVGVAFVGENIRNIGYNLLEVNTITSGSHGITFTTEAVGSFQNTVRFNHIKAGGAGCYGIAYFNPTDASTFGEDSFYGGHISDCEWACYGIRANSKFYGIEIETNVQGGFYIYSGVSIFHPRIAESQRDGNLPIYKFINTSHTTIYDSSGISINQIDLSEANETYVTSGNEHLLTENRISKINGKIIARIIDGEDTIGNNYCHNAYIWGKYFIMMPFMAYRKEVTTATLDTRLIGRTEETYEEIKTLSQLPTKFVINTTNTEVYLHESYCAFGFNEFEVEQANGFTCKIYDKLDNLIFDGTEQGDGLYKLNVYKDATYCASRSGTLRTDFLGHYWSATKQSISATDDGKGNVTLTTGVINV